MGTESWSTSTRYYDIAGTLAQSYFTYDNGTFSRYGYDDRGRTGWLQEYYDTGIMQYYTDWDQADTSLWERFVDCYDLAGVFTQRHLFYDDGTDVWI